MECVFPRGGRQCVLFGDTYEKFQVVLPSEKRSEDVCFHLTTIHLSLLKGNTHVFSLFSPYKTPINGMYKPCRSNYVISL